MTKTESPPELIDMMPDPGQDTSRPEDAAAAAACRPQDGPIDAGLSAARAVLLSADPDPDARREASAGLIEHIDRLDAMLRHTKDMITVLDENGLVMFSNAAAGLLTGHGEEVNNTTALDFIHPEDQQTASDAFDSCLEVPGSFANAELRVRHADGSWHYVDAYAENCLDDPVTGVVVSMRDVCDRRRSEESLQRANEALRSFVAVASHDLRSPVAVIRGLAGALASDWAILADQERLDIAQMVARASERMGRLVENLLMISRLDAGVTAGQPRRVELRQAVSLAGRHLEEVGPIGLAVPEGLEVWVDQEHLERILTNYLHNAASHGLAPVTVEAAPAGSLVEIRVLDSGPGVPEELVPRLFERFFRADARETLGTGLGLSIVRDLAQAAGGDAWYEPGRGGACFVVSLPASGTTDADTPA